MIKRLSLLIFIFMFFLFSFYSTFSYDDLTITEIMYNPLGPDNDLEYIEIYNPKNILIDFEENPWFFVDQYYYDRFKMMQITPCYMLYNNNASWKTNSTFILIVEQDSLVDIYYNLTRYTTNYCDNYNCSLDVIYANISFFCVFDPNKQRGNRLGNGLNNNDYIEIYNCSNEDILECIDYSYCEENETSFDNCSVYYNCTSCDACYDCSIYGGNCESCDGHYLSVEWTSDEGGKNNGKSLHYYEYTIYDKINQENVTYYGYQEASPSPGEHTNITIMPDDGVSLEICLDGNCKNEKAITYYEYTSLYKLRNLDYYDDENHTKTYNVTVYYNISFIDNNVTSLIKEDILNLSGLRKTKSASTGSIEFNETGVYQICACILNTIPDENNVSLFAKNDNCDCKMITVEKNPIDIVSIKKESLNFGDYNSIFVEIDLEYINNNFSLNVYGKNKRVVSDLDGNSMYGNDFDKGTIFDIDKIKNFNESFEISNNNTILGEYELFFMNSTRLFISIPFFIKPNCNNYYPSGSYNLTIGLGVYENEKWKKFIERDFSIDIGGIKEELCPITSSGSSGYSKKTTKLAENQMRYDKVMVEDNIEFYPKSLAFDVYLDFENSDDLKKSFDIESYISWANTKAKISNIFNTIIYIDDNNLKNLSYNLTVNRNRLREIISKKIKDNKKIENYLTLKIKLKSPNLKNARYIRRKFIFDIDRFLNSSVDDSSIEKKENQNIKDKYNLEKIYTRARKFEINKIIKITTTLNTEPNTNLKLKIISLANALSSIYDFNLSKSLTFNYTLTTNFDILYIFLYDEKTSYENSSNLPILYIYDFRIIHILNNNGTIKFIDMDRLKSEILFFETSINDLVANKSLITHSFLNAKNLNFGSLLGYMQDENQQQIKKALESIGDKNIIFKSKDEKIKIFLFVSLYLLLLMFSIYLVLKKT